MGSVRPRATNPSARTAEGFRTLRHSNVTIDICGVELPASARTGTRRPAPARNTSSGTAASGHRRRPLSLAPVRGKAHF
jgi:hypothetical protein